MTHTDCFNISCTTGFNSCFWQPEHHTINVRSVIKTHGSESRGQEEAGLRDVPVSYLQVAPL